MTFNAPEAAFGVSEHKLGWSAQAGFAFLNRKRGFSELTLHYLGAPGMTVEGFTVGNPYSPAGRVAPCSGSTSGIWTSSLTPVMF